MTHIIQKAFQFARDKHKGQTRDGGEDYFESHVRKVASTIMSYSSDDEVIAAAYLHDTLEDTQTTLEELTQEFGERVANLVHELTHEGDKKTGYYFPRLKSRDAILIKFADRLCNLSDMGSWDKERQEQYLRKSKFWRSQ